MEEEEIQPQTDFNEVICPICLDSPHNAVLLICSSNDKGCRSFVCDTDHLHSNCLVRFKEANRMPRCSHTQSNSSEIDADSDMKTLFCPLCRGEVVGWVVVDRARTQLDELKRCCEEAKCLFTGTYSELRKHARNEHPHAFPSKIDPARRLDWENFQRSAEIVDVLTTIHSEIPRGVVLGDYVIEYGDEDNSSPSGDEFRRGDDDDRGNWWTSCILYQVFQNFRASRNGRRTRSLDSRRGFRRSSSDEASNSDEGSVASVEYADYGAGGDIDYEFVSARGSYVGRSAQPSSRRRHHSRLHDI